MKAILTDVTKCIGCAQCVVACKEINKLPPDFPRRWHKDDGLSARNWTSVLTDGKYYVRKQCRHCLEPNCVSVCPVGALSKTDFGAVVYDKDKCIGCRYCMMACPYGIPRYEWESPSPYIQKCVLCYENIVSGKIKEPACVTACPEKATIFGDRDELIKEARRRIKAEPDKYLDHIYGEKEVGGSNVLYITAKDCPLDFLLYYSNRADKNKPLRGEPGINEPIPTMTKPAMEAVPFAFIGMGALMGGVYWTIKRREKLMKNEANNKEENSDE